MKPAQQILLFLFFLPSFRAFCQNHGDCQTALEVCNLEPIEVAGTTGTGVVDDSLVNTCLFSELASTWFRWKIAAPGKLTFTLTPEVAADLDFAVFKMDSMGNCAAKIVVRCMAAGETVGDPTGSQPCLGPTGLKETESDVEELPGCGNGNNNFLAALDGLLGDEYLLVVNNFSENVEGFKLEWGGTAVIDCNLLSAFSVLPQALGLQPNPAHGFLDLYLPGRTGTSTCRVVDGVGATLYSGSFYGPSERLSLDGWPAGIYYLMVEQDGKLLTRRFFKD